MIMETVVTTVSTTGAVHVAPMGIREGDGRVLLAPFKPSTTLNNLLTTRRAVVNLIDDVRVFAGCVTGRRDWPTVPVEGDDGAMVRLSCALAHRELAVATVEDDPLRPQIWCEETRFAHHQPFAGFNRPTKIPYYVGVGEVLLLRDKRNDVGARHSKPPSPRASGVSVACW